MKLKVIQNKIYEIRGQKIIFDFDLSEMYGVQNRILKQSVKRNLDRFPDDFMFVLTRKEWLQVITNCDNLPVKVTYSPTPPFAFTEQGVAMLASILNSKKAIKINIEIVRVFVFI